MEIIALGGDGFCGWTTALHLSKRGREIVIIDNFPRRRSDDVLGVQSLTPISPLKERIDAWFELTGLIVWFIELGIAREYDALLELFCAEQPECMVHFAIQRAAPYSMKTSPTKNYTISNNSCGARNALNAIVESRLDIHLAHLGAMGVYGYGHEEPIPVTEGYLDVKIPANDARLINRFDYDGDYGVGDLVVRNDLLRSIGWEPILNKDGLLLEVSDVTQLYRDRADRSKLSCVSCWTRSAMQSAHVS